MCTRFLRLFLLLLVVSVRPALAQSVYGDRYVFNTGPCTVSSGSGSPEGAVTGVVCDTYLRTDTADLYTKVSGSGTTGWAILPRLAAANSWTATQTHANNTALQWLDSGAAAHTMLKLDNLDRASINPDAFLLTIGGATTFSSTVAMQSNASVTGTLGVTGAVTGASYTGGAISGTTGTFSSNVGITAGNLTLTAGNVTLTNGTFHVTHADTSILMLMSGTTLGVRLASTATWAGIEGVDTTGAASYQPLWVNGSIVQFANSGVEKMRLTGSNLLIGTTTGTPGAGTAGIVFGQATVLSSMASNTAGLNAVDVAGTAHMFAVSEAGVSMQLTGAANNTLATAVQQNITDTGTLVDLAVTGDATFGANAGTSSYVSQTTGWRITNPGAGDLRSIVVESLNAKSYIINYEQALAGGQLITKSAAALSAAFTVPAVGGGSGIAITRVGAVATANTSPFAHGLTTGDSVWISGATQTEYNGLFTVTVTDTTHFTFTVSGTPATPATGTIVSRGAATLDVEDLPGSPGVALFQIGDQVMLRSVSRNTTTTTTGGFVIGSVYGSIVSGATFLTGHQQWVFARNTAIVGTGTLDRGVTIAAKAVALDYGTSGSGWLEQTVNDGTIDSVLITRVSSTATATTGIPHGYKTGDVVYISGANQPEYNGAFTITVTDSTHFTYTVSGTPTTPATGTMLVNATNGTNAPYTQVSTFTGSPAPSTTTVRCRWGNLRGLTGTLEYGSFCGNFGGNAYVRFSDQNAEIKGIPLSLVDGSTVTVKLDPSVPSFALGNPLPSAYGTGVGVWMGKDSGAYKFRVGDPAGGKIAFDGTTVTAAGWTLTATALTGGSVTIDSAGNVRAGQSAFNTGTGFWLGTASGTAKFSIGDGTTKLVWDGAALTMSGADITLTGASTSPVAAATYKFAAGTGFGGTNDTYGIAASMLTSSPRFRKMSAVNWVVPTVNTNNVQGAIDIRTTGWNGTSHAATDEALIQLLSGDGSTALNTALINFLADGFSFSGSATFSDSTLGVAGGVTVATQVLAANTSADGLVMSNGTPATAGNQRYSPRLHMTGQGWKTNATAGSQPVDAIQELRPVQGTANPSSTLAWAFAVNGGGYTDRMTLTSGGNLSLPTGNVDAVNAFVARPGIGGASAGNAFSIYWTGTTAQLWIDSANAGTITLTSDRRVKQNIRPIPAGLAEVLQLRPAAFEWLNDDASESKDMQFGLIAQDVRLVLPNLVARMPTMTDSGRAADGLLRVDYVEMIPVLIRAIQQLEDEVAALRLKVGGGQ
jgi:hypothetical protein